MHVDPNLITNPSFQQVFAHFKPIVTETLELSLVEPPPCVNPYRWKLAKQMFAGIDVYDTWRNGETPAICKTLAAIENAMTLPFFGTHSLWYVFTPTTDEVRVSDFNFPIHDAATFDSYIRAVDGFRVFAQERRTNDYIGKIITFAAANGVALIDRNSLLLSIFDLLDNIAFGGDVMYNYALSVEYTPTPGQLAALDAAIVALKAEWLQLWGYIDGKIINNPAVLVSFTTGNSMYTATPGALVCVEKFADENVFSETYNSLKIFNLLLEDDEQTLPELHGQLNTLLDDAGLPHTITDLDPPNWFAFVEPGDPEGLGDAYIGVTPEYCYGPDGTTPPAQSLLAVDNTRQLRAQLGRVHTLHINVHSNKYAGQLFIPDYYGGCTQGGGNAFSSTKDHRYHNTVETFFAQDAILSPGITDMVMVHEWEHAEQFATGPLSLISSIVYLAGPSEPYTGAFPRLYSRFFDFTVAAEGAAMFSERLWRETDIQTIYTAQDVRSAAAKNLWHQRSRTPRGFEGVAVGAGVFTIAEMRDYLNTHAVRSYSTSAVTGSYVRPPLNRIYYSPAYEVLRDLYNQLKANPICFAALEASAKEFRTLSAQYSPTGHRILEEVLLDYIASDCSAKLY